ncbi:MAG: hypothetical protein ACRDPQ_23080, partial [Nocardioidaceae bacterium]
MGTRRAVRLGRVRPYYVARLDDAAVAGIGSSPGADVPPRWITYTCVYDVDAAASAALEAGGRDVVAAMGPLPEANAPARWTSTSGRATRTP